MFLVVYPAELAAIVERMLVYAADMGDIVTVMLRRDDCDRFGGAVEVRHSLIDFALSRLPQSIRPEAIGEARIKPGCSAEELLKQCDKIWSQIYLDSEELLGLIGVLFECESFVKCIRIALPWVRRVIVNLRAGSERESSFA